MTFPSAVGYAEEDLYIDEYQNPYVGDGFDHSYNEPTSEDIYGFPQDEYYAEDTDQFEDYDQYYVENYASFQNPDSYELILQPLTFAPIAAVAVSILLGLLLFGLIKPIPGLRSAPDPSAGTDLVPPAGPIVQPIPAGTGIAPLFTPAIQHWAPQIQEWAANWNLDPNLVATVMQIESCGDPSAVSVAGAMGLFQVMPFHFEQGEDGYDPQTNAKRGMAYLHQALQARGGEPRLALAGYNGGIAGAKRPENQWPSETQRYVYWGTGIYEDALAGKDQSSHLNEWLAKGGSGLCERASTRLGLSQ